MKNICICLMVILIITFTFGLPSLLLELEDRQMNGLSYSREEAENSIDVQVENIYLVKVIHEIEDGLLNLEIDKSYGVTKIYDKVDTDENSKMSEIFQKFNEETQKMKENGALGRIWQDSGKNEYSYAAYDKKYGDSKNEYILHSIALELNTPNEFYADIEKKTGKILHYVAYKNYGVPKKMSEKEILENYIRYLDLYIIDDWIFENNCMWSNKAKLVASLRFYEETYILSIHSSMGNRSDSSNQTISTSLNIK